MAVNFRRPFALAMLATLTGIPPAFSQTALPGETALVVYNASNADAVCMVTSSQGAGTQDGCPTSPFSLRARDLTTNGTEQPLVPFGASPAPSGWFRVPRGHRVQLYNIGINPYTRKRSACLQGFVMGFNQFGNECPDALSGGIQFPNTTPGPLFNQATIPPLPNGSNAFEPTLNLSGTLGGVVGGATAEGMDISCNKGANCIMNVSLIPPAGGPYWQTDLGPRGGGKKTFTSVTSFQNSWVDFAHKCDDNCVDPKTGLARPGVFPYGCSQCNVLPDPVPSCGSGQQFCAAKNGLPIAGSASGAVGTGCSYTRAPILVQGSQAMMRFGGTVQVNYLGPLSPPLSPPKATCL